MLPETRWIFWDLDGTLADSVPALYQAYRGFLKDRKARPTKTEFDRLNGPALPEIVRHLKRKHGLKAAEKELLKAYREKIRTVYARRAKLMKGARRVLSGLSREGYRHALVSSASASLAVPVLRKNRIASYFDHSVFGDGLKRAKPHPEIYRRALKKTSAEPRNVWAIEDSRNGALSARRAGVRVIRVTGPNALADIETRLTRGQRFDRRVIRLRKGLRVTAANRPAGESKLFAIDSMRDGNGLFEIRGRFRPYSVYRRGGCTALGVSGRVVSHAGGQRRYLLGRRSSKVFRYKGCWEMVPSGGVDGSSWRKGGRIDLKRMLLSELREEAGLRATAVRSFRELFLAYDRGAKAWDVCVALELRGITRKDLDFNKEEYDTMDFYPKKKAESLLLRQEHTVPVSVELWKHAQKEKGGL